MNKEQILEFIKNKSIVGILNITNRTKYEIYNKKFTYMFQPLNKEYPPFLIPFKKGKYTKDLFIIIQYKEWKNKLPIGICEKLIGNIDDNNSELEALIYQYECYNKKIIIKQKIKNKHTIYNFMKKNEIKQYKKINTEIISIDPQGCLDIDDCLSYNKEKQLIGIHIADPSFWIDKLNLNIEDNYFSIYAPHRTLNMIPSILSNHLCSLREDKDRLSLTLWIQLKDNKIQSYQYEKCIIKNKKAYSYEEAEDLIGNNKLLTDLYELSKIIGTQYNYDINKWNTHKLIEVFMVMANNLTGKYMKENNKIALFRTHDSSNIILDKNIPNTEIRDFLKIFQSNAAIYKTSNKSNQYFHYGLKLNEYVTFTSPIRRYTDLITHKIIKEELNEDINELCIKINNKEKMSKKLYREFNKLNMVNNMNKHIFEAYIINFENNDINIYIPEYKVYDNIRLDFENSKVSHLIELNNNINTFQIKSDTTKLTFSKYEKIKIEVFYINRRINYKIINKNINVFN